MHRPIFLGIAIGRMAVVRTVIAGMVIAVAGCSGDPRSYGITGPGHAVAPPGDTSQAPPPMDTPGVPPTGGYYGPGFGPTHGSTGFWGYND